MNNRILKIEQILAAGFIPVPHPDKNIKTALCYEHPDFGRMTYRELQKFMRFYKGEK